MQNFIVANRGLDQMPEEQIQRARTHHLEHLRNSIIPAKQTLIAAMRVFRDSTGSLLGHSLTQAIFFERLYDVTPKDYKSWNRNRKKSYETARSVYRQRYNEVLPKCTYQTLMQHERDKFDALLKMLTDYVDMINDATRDVEIAFSIPHDGKPDSYLTFDIDPPLRSVYDVELERRREIRDKKIVLRSNECPECRTNEYVMSTVLGKCPHRRGHANACTRQCLRQVRNRHCIFTNRRDQGRTSIRHSVQQGAAWRLLRHD